MGAFVDLTGRTVGYWAVLARGENSGSVTRWLCRCVCGTERLVRAGHLASGASTNCGCIRPPKKHGQAVGKGFTKKYRTWRSMMARCTNPNHKNASIYYGLMCSEWLEFTNFDKDVPDPPSIDHTIDRIENERGYEPGNVRWVLMAEQHRNQRNCRWIEFNGKRQLLTDWAKELGISASSLHERIKKWGINDALSR